MYYSISYVYIVVRVNIIIHRSYNICILYTKVRMRAATLLLLTTAMSYVIPSAQSQTCAIVPNKRI